MGFHKGWPEHADQVCNLTGMLPILGSSRHHFALAWKLAELCNMVCPHAAVHLNGLFCRGMQATFFLALSVAGQLGTASLAAHQVVAQLWLLPAYVVDAFAVAGTVLGSRLVATIELPDSLRHAASCCLHP